MAPVTKFPFRTFALLTTIPAVVIGAALWFFAGLAPQCVIDEQQRLASPDSAFDLVIFSRDCGGDTLENTQAALIPSGEAFPEDAASFFSVGATASLAPRWTASGEIELTIPGDAEVYREDRTVAGIAVIYR